MGGNVTGPASSTDTAVARWNGTSGTVIQDSSVLIDGSNNISGINSISSDAGTFTSDGSGNVTAASFNGVFNGTSTTQSPGDNSTNLATTAYVDTGFAGLSLASLSDVVVNYTDADMFLGQGAGASISGGINNVGLGTSALATLSSGQSNVAVGASALSATPNAFNCIAIGDSAMGSAGGSPTNNIAIGTSALAVGGGQKNIAIGTSALAVSTGPGGSPAHNVAIGDHSLSILTTGTNNIAIGDTTGATLTTGSNNVLIGVSANVPTSSTSNYINIGGAITGATSALHIGGSPTTTTQSPGDNSTNIATTAYVDTSISAITAGLDSRPSCRVTTTAALTATYSNGSSGVGATLTNSGTQVAISIDGVALSSGDRVLVKNQSTAAQNGIYTVTTVGSGSTNWVLTRATDFNTASGTGVVEGAFTVIEEGTTQFGTFWIETGPGPFTIGTTAITFTQLQVTNVNLTNGHILVGNASNIGTDVAMSGDVTISNTGATTIASNAVSNAKFRQSAGLSVVGNTGSSTANVADITGTANQVLVVNSGGTALSFGKVNLTSAAGVTGTLPLANIATIANNTILGNNSGSTASPIALTAAQTKTVLAIANTDVSGLGTMSTQNASSVAITGGSITGMSTPVNGSDVATKSYVDASTAGLSAHTSCRVGTTAALTATYNNGTSGVGATLTNSGTQAAIAIDGVSLSSGDRVLVKNQSTAAQNGIYTVTTVGSGSTNWVLTRATDFNTGAPNGIVEGAYTVIEEGTANAGTLWIETGTGPFTVGTTAITFTELSVAPQTLTFTGDVTGTGSGSIALSIGASKVTNTMLAGSIAASKLVGTDIATVGTITSGTWNGAAISGTYIASSVALAGSPTTTTQSSSDNSTKIATTAFVQSAVGSSPFTSEFISSTQTMPATSAKLTVAHGLGAKPKLVRVVLICTTAANGYSIGDEADIQAPSGYMVGNIGATISADTTNVYVSTGSVGTTSFVIAPKAGGVGAYALSADWGIKVYAWK